jgi:hypothetical protein
MRSAGYPIESQIWRASSSEGWIVTQTRSAGNWSQSVTNSQAQGMIVSLK